MLGAATDIFFPGGNPGQLPLPPSRIVQATQIHRLPSVSHQGDHE